MNERRYPWLILVPALAGLTEWHAVPRDRQRDLMEDINTSSGALTELFNPDKINVAALGNQVPQLHIHVVARFQTDAAWPDPVWGKFAPLPYAQDAAEALIARLRSRLN